MEREPLRFYPGLRTPRLPTTHAEAETGHRALTRVLHLRHQSNLNGASHFHSCTLTSHIIAGCLDYHTRHLVGEQMISQRQDLVAHRALGRHRRPRARSAAPLDPDTSLRILLRDVDARTPRMHYLHHRSSRSVPSTHHDPHCVCRRVCFGEDGMKQQSDIRAHRQHSTVPVERTTLPRQATLRAHRHRSRTGIDRNTLNQFALRPRPAPANRPGAQPSRRTHFQPHGGIAAPLCSHAQLLDIIHSRDLQNRDPQRRLRLISGPGRGFRCARHQAVLCRCRSTQPAVSQRYATSSGTVAIAPGGYATPSWTTRYSGATTTLVMTPAA